MPWGWRLTVGAEAPERRSRSSWVPRPSQTCPRNSAGGLAGLHPRLQSDSRSRHICPGWQVGQGLSRPWLSPAHIPGASAETAGPTWRWLARLVTPRGHPEADAPAHRQGSQRERGKARQPPPLAPHRFCCTCGAENSRGRPGPRGEKWAPPGNGRGRLLRPKGLGKERTLS